MATKKKASASASAAKKTSSAGSKKAAVKKKVTSTKKTAAPSVKTKSSATTKKSSAAPAKLKKKAATPPSPKKGIMKKEKPAKKAAPKKVVPKKASTAPAKKAAPKKAAAPVKKVAEKKAPLKATVKKVEEAPKASKELKSVQIPAPSEGKASKAIVLSRGAGPVRRPKKPSGNSTPKLEPRVKKDSSKNEEMFERTQSAPTISAPKVTEFFQSTSYQTPEPVKPKPNVRYSDKDLKMFKELIDSEKEKTLEELRMLKERLEDLTNYEASEETAVYSMHMAEQGSEAVEREKTYAQIQRTTDYLRKLDEALTRIGEKTYGICRQCGILIAKERLMAVPITTLSASWKLRQQCPTDGVDRIGK